MQPIEQIMTTSPVIPVIVINDIDDAVPMAQALVNGGLKVLEITLRTPQGLEAIKLVKEQVPGAIVGAGTVVTAEDVQACKEAGAEFLVSPGWTPALVDAAKESGIPFLLGTANPSDVMALLDLGVTHMKFFPAEAAGGVKMLGSIGAPLAQAKFCPTGGINLNNLSDYLALPNVLCVGGTWMVSSKLVEAKDWAEIERISAEAVKLATA